MELFKTTVLSDAVDSLSVMQKIGELIHKRNCYTFLEDT